MILLFFCIVPLSRRVTEGDLMAFSASRYQPWRHLAHRRLRWRSQGKRAKSTLPLNFFLSLHWGLDPVGRKRHWDAGDGGILVELVWRRWLLCVVLCTMTGVGLLLYHRFYYFSFYWSNSRRLPCVTAEKGNGIFIWSIMDGAKHKGEQGGLSKWLSP